MSKRSNEDTEEILGTIHQTFSEQWQTEDPYREHRMWIIRGLPGSGKTTLAKLMAKLLPKSKAVSTDDYFYTHRGYEFDPELLPWAHTQCQKRVRWLLEEHEWEIATTNIIIHNTFSQNWEIEPYKKLAKRFGWEVFIIEAQNNFGSVHNVPKETVKRMEQRWEKNTND